MRDLLYKKEIIRKKIKNLLKKTSEKNKLDAAEKVAQNVQELLKRWDLDSTLWIAGYIPLAGEICLDPLWNALKNLGFSFCLPIPQQNHRRLLFGKWAPGEPLEKDFLGTLIPQSLDLKSPQVLLVPLIAFDQEGYRLGRGGGFYDTTLAELRPLGVRTIGIGFEKQYVKNLPREFHDQPLDGIVTEKRIYGPFKRQ